MLLYRVLSAIVLIPLVLFTVWQGKILLLLVTALIILIGAKEMHMLLRKMQVNHSLLLSVAGGLLFLLTAYIDNESNIGIIITFIILANLTKLVLTYPKYKAMDIAATLLSTYYIGWLPVHFYNLRQLDHGFHFVLLMLLTTWATDTFAYFVGINFGRHKLAPLLSPKKSIEGSIGGVLGAILTAYLFALINPETTLINYLLIGFLVGIFSQVGDLAESVLKRIAGVKDSGHLIPGHGGLLDRIDSILFTAPLVYYYAKMFIIS